MAVLSTGVPNLDTILGGGIPRGSLMLVVGGAGSGKTTLTWQTASAIAAQSQGVIYVTTLSEPPNWIVQHMRTFSFFDEAFIGRQIHLINAFPLIRGDLGALHQALVGAVREHEAPLLVIDGLQTLYELVPGEQDIRKFLYELKTALTGLQTTIVVTTIQPPEPAPLGTEFTIADGILQLEMITMGARTVRRVHCEKMRGQAPLLGQHVFKITGDGLVVFPRLESVVTKENVGLEMRRVPTGLAELDVMMQGGPLSGSTTLIAGATGTGKTVMSLHFLIEGVRRGEKGLMVGFYEAPRQLVDQARLLNLDLETPLGDGRIVIRPWSSASAEADEVAWDMLQEIERLRPRRLVIDSIGELERGLQSESRAGFDPALTRLLRQRGVTSFVTKEIAKVVGPELDFSDTPAASLTENLILLRWVEFKGVLYRIISVLKMRSSDHDRSIRQYVIADHGMRVLERMESAEDVLTGIAHLPSAPRAPRETPEPATVKG